MTETRNEPHPTDRPRLPLARLARLWQDFLHVESASGLVLLAATCIALIASNSPIAAAYHGFWQTRLGFDLPLHDLRYWLLGVPDPGSQFELARDDQDRAQQLMQAGWTVAYERYMAVGGDWLPARLVLTCPGVRVRVVVDRWQGLR